MARLTDRVPTQIGVFGCSRSNGQTLPRELEVYSPKNGSGVAGENGQHDPTATVHAGGKCRAHGLHKFVSTKQGCHRK